MHGHTFTPALTEYSVTARPSLSARLGWKRQDQSQEGKHCHHLKLPLSSLYTRPPRVLSYFRVHSSLISSPHPSSCLPLSVAVTPAVFPPPCIYSTSLLSLSHTLCILYFSLFPTASSCSVTRALSPLSSSLLPCLPHIPCFICPSVHISVQTWQAAHKGPFQSDYFGHAPEFHLGHAAWLYPPRRLVTLCFTAPRLFLKNASKFPLHWRSRPFSPMPGG